MGPVGLSTFFQEEEEAERSRGDNLKERIALVGVGETHEGDKWK